MKTASRLWPDLLPVILLTALGVLVTQDTSGSTDDTVWDTILVPTATVWVFWWRRAPLVAAVGIAAGMVISGIPTFDQTRCGYILPGALLILFSLAQREERAPSLLGLAAIEAGVVFMLFTDPQLDAGAAFLLVLCAGVWGAGRLYRSRTRVAAELAERTRDLEQTREETAQLAVEVERAQVAADLDVAARDQVRAVVDLARKGEAASDGQSREAFEEIEREGRESLNRMRELLGVLRSDDRDTSPRPTLAQLETLLAHARAGGRAVDLRVEGERRPLPSGLELAAYRVVQHALEALGVAGGAPASVGLRYSDTELELTVTGATPSGEPAESALDAARERAAAYGGSLSTTPQGGGRVLVRAELPLPVPSG
jgi:signal transduction histidine kinase